MSDLQLVVRATLALYRNALRDASRALVRHLWVVILLPAYTILLGAVAAAAGALGFLGGLVMYLALAACVSSFLAIVAGAVEHVRMRPSELAPSFGRYLRGIVSVAFLLWIIQLLLGLIVEQNPGMRWVALAVNTGIFLLCNPLPELIYQGSREGMAMIDEAVQFTRENSIEWLIPVALLVLPVFLVSPGGAVVLMAEMGPTSVLALLTQVLEAFLPDLGRAGAIVTTLLAGTVLTWVMLFRGFLFRALSRGGRRQRIFAARSGQL